MKGLLVDIAILIAGMIVIASLAKVVEERKEQRKDVIHYAR